MRSTEETTRIMAEVSKLTGEASVDEFFIGIGLDFNAMAEMVEELFPEDQMAQGALLTGINQGVILARVLDGET